MQAVHIFNERMRTEYLYLNDTLQIPINDRDRESFETDYSLQLYFTNDCRHGSYRTLEESWGGFVDMDDSDDV